jgi:hypothetical protein
MIKTFEVLIKRSKNNRWNIKIDDELLGQVDSLNEATNVLWDAGYKAHTYRRGVTTTGKPLFKATVIKKEA